MNVHGQYPKHWSSTKRIIVECKCGVHEIAYVRGQARPKLCTAHSKPIKSASRRGADEVPTRYLLQVQHYVAITGSPIATLA